MSKQTQVIQLALVDNYLNQCKVTGTITAAAANNKALHAERVTLIEQLGGIPEVTTALSTVLGSLEGTKAQKQAYKRSLARALRIVFGEGNTYSFKMDRLIVSKAEPKAEKSDLDTVEEILTGMIGSAAPAIMKAVKTEVERIRKETVVLKKHQETISKKEKAATIADLQKQIADLQAEG